MIILLYHPHLIGFKKHGQRGQEEDDDGSLSPSGSTSRASFSASEVARSEFAGDTHRIRELGLEMKDRIISWTWVSMSSGWSPTGTWGEEKNVWNQAVYDKKKRIICNQERKRNDVAVVTLVIPGKSTKVRFRTLGEKIFRWMGSALMPYACTYTIFRTLIIKKKN